MHRPEGHRQDHQQGPQHVFAKGCKVKVVYKKSHKKKGTVLSINRKVGKKLVFRALVKVTIAKPF